MPANTMVIYPICSFHSCCWCNAPDGCVALPLTWTRNASPFIGTMATHGSEPDYVHFLSGELRSFLAQQLFCHTVNSVMQLASPASQDRPFPRVRTPLGPSLSLRWVFGNKYSTPMVKHLLVIVVGCPVETVPEPT